jgi:hypothetical protein
VSLYEAMDQKDKAKLWRKKREEIKAHNKNTVK